MSVIVSMDSAERAGPSARQKHVAGPRCSMSRLGLIASTLSVGIALVVQSVSANAAVVPTVSAKLASANPAAAGSPSNGVYAGPAQTGVTGATAFDTAMGTTSTEVLDFAATDQWGNIEGPHWMLAPHAGQTARLEYSLPMFPTGGGNSLSACAAGTYNSHWAALGTNLVAANLASTIIRPGWEFNGNWYTWSATGQAAAYAGCFRQIVTTMRATPGQQFTYDWNVAVGDTTMSTATISAYPGDAYVDYVGVDVYDTSWSLYSNNAPTSAQQTSAWNYLLRGPSGLNYWSAFAASHAKPMSLPEWGVAKLGNGHGGGDDPAFVANMFAFMTNPTNNVAYDHYFNYDVGTTIHSLTGGQFPNSLAQFRTSSAALGSPAAGSRATASRPASPTSSALSH